MAADRNQEIAYDIMDEAPVRPQRGGRFFVFLGFLLVVLVWSFHGAKIRPGELIEGIPQIGQTLARMLPPDFSKITDAKHYYFPEHFSLS